MAEVVLRQKKETLEVDEARELLSRLMQEGFDTLCYLDGDKFTVIWPASLKAGKQL